MPYLICRFCNTEFKLTLPYYCHLHTHINNTTINDFTKDELDTINKYYNYRKNIRCKSHYKHVINPKHECLLCDYKSKQTAAYEKHLVNSHTKEELLTINDKHYIEKIINKYKVENTNDVLPVPIVLNLGPFTLPPPFLFPLALFIPLIDG
jgi:hypothetical protein